MANAKKANLNIRHVEIINKLSEEYKNMNSAVRRKLDLLVVEDKKRYEKEIQEFHALKKKKEAEKKVDKREKSKEKGRSRSRYPQKTQAEDKSQRETNQKMERTQVQTDMSFLTLYFFRFDLFMIKDLNLINISKYYIPAKIKIFFS